MSEQEIKNHYLGVIAHHFHIDMEVSGVHFSGKQLKLDAIAKPKDPLQWKNQDVSLGIEFKDTERFSRNYDTKDFTKWLAQCIDYSNTHWEKYGYVYIFTCPSLIGGVAPGVIGQSMFIENFMGQLGIGELKELPGYGLTFVLHGHHRIWSATKGIESGKHWALERKFGSR